MSARVSIFHMNIFVGAKSFDLNISYISLKKIYIIYNKMTNIRAFILHLRIPCDKISVLLTRYLLAAGLQPSSHKKLGWGTGKLQCHPQQKLYIHCAQKVAHGLDLISQYFYIREVMIFNLYMYMYNSYIYFS